MNRLEQAWQQSRPDNLRSRYIDSTLTNFAKFEKLRFVTHTWNSKVFGLATCTAGMSSISFLNFVEMSSREQRLKVRASVNPLWAT